MGKLFRRKSVFFIVLVVFIAVLIPLYILGLGIYQWGSQMTKEEIANSQYASVDFYMGTLESETPYRCGWSSGGTKQARRAKPSPPRIGGDGLSRRLIRRG